MDDVTRRTLLAATAAGGIFTAARAAGAETSKPVPQPQRPGRGGTDPSPRNLALRSFCFVDTHRGFSAHRACG
jgi:oxalate decarboxylase